MTSLPPWLTVTGDPVPDGIDGHASRTRAGFFREVARMLQFPDYFGHNWDAFRDCLRDLHRPTIIVARADELLLDEDPRQLTILLDVLADAAKDGLTATFATSPGRAAALEDRVASALL
jgi:RNAse (barnase) inhibitor barstar